jgi:translation elongation factor EF-Tu-like GTPase
MHISHHKGSKNINSISGTKSATIAKHKSNMKLHLRVLRNSFSSSEEEASDSSRAFKEYRYNFNTRTTTVTRKVKEKYDNSAEDPSSLNIKTAKTIAIADMKTLA